MIRLEIQHCDEDRNIILHAETMKELIDKKLPAWLPTLKEDLPLIKKTKRFKDNPKKVEAEERASGWYYDC